MRNSQARSRYEQSLATAHRAIYRAIDQAEQLGDQGAEHDCHQILKEIQRLAEASLRGKVRPMRGQAELPLG